MASIIKASINLNEIPKDKIINGKKGKYLPISITLNDEPDQFGNQGPVIVEQTKEERDAKTAKTYLGNVRVVGFDNLTVELAKTHEASIIIRGLRAVSDFEYELQLGYLNNSLDDTIETVYLMPKLKHAFISSSIVRNLLKFNGKTEHLLPKEVQKIIGSMTACTLQ